MLRFLPQTDFTLVVPDDGMVAGLRVLMANGQPANRAYLDTHTGQTPVGRITGSFIYSHPPDYIGRPTMDYGVAEWRAQLRDLKQLGIDTVIYQAAGWVEVRECYYPSKHFDGYHSWDSLSKLVDAVAAESMTLFLGGLGNMLAFDERATAATLDADAREQLICFRELLAYRGGFQGFYMSPETGYPGARQPAREKLLNRYYSQVCQGVKDLAPDLPILMSPGTYYYAGQEREIRDFLYSMLQGCPVDILAPQDSIGTFGNTLSNYRPAFTIWREVCEALDVALWVNAESFERARIGTACDFEPASIERLSAQLALAADFASKIVSWEVPHFYSESAGAAGLRLRAEYLKLMGTSLASAGGHPQPLR